MKVHIVSFDLDGCVNRKEFGNDINKLLNGNKKLFGQIKKPGYKKTVLFSGSTRQDSDTEFNNICLNPHRIKSYEIFPKLAKDLGAEHDQFLLADIANNTNAGYMYSSIETNIKNMLSPGENNQSQDTAQETSKNWIADENKLSLLYAQIHKAANDYPDEEITFDFYDDRQDILGKLKSFYQKHPQLVPQNVTLNLHNYKAAETSKGTEPVYIPYAFIQGTGEIDNNYRKTLKVVEKIASEKNTDLIEILTPDNLVTIFGEDKIQPEFSNESALPENADILDFDKSVITIHTCTEDFIKDRNNNKYGATSEKVGWELAARHMKNGIKQFLQLDPKKQHAIATFNNDPEMIAAFYSDIIDGRGLKLTEDSPHFSHEEPGIATNVYTIDGTDRLFYISYIPAGENYIPTVLKLTAEDGDQKNSQIKQLHQLMKEHEQVSQSSKVRLFDDSIENCKKAAELTGVTSYIVLPGPNFTCEMVAASPVQSSKLYASNEAYLDDEGSTEYEEVSWARQLSANSSEATVSDSEEHSEYEEVPWARHFSANSNKATAQDSKGHSDNKKNDPTPQSGRSSKGNALNKVVKTLLSRVKGTLFCTSKAEKQSGSVQENNEANQGASL